MTNGPGISVVMAVHNEERHLCEAIDSILSQTLKDFEFIIINDGSTDSTQEILESYTDPRILLIQQEHIGLTKSLNKGISLAKGEYIARQDGDDISLPERLQTQIRFLESHKNIALLGTAAEIIDERGIQLKRIEYPTDHNSLRKAMKKSNHFWHGSVIFKRSCFFELGGYRELFFTAQDYDLWLRFIEKFQVANLSTALYKYRLTSRSLTSKKIVLQRRMARFAKQLARAREKQISEALVNKALKQFLKSPLSSAEKKDIIEFYNYWSLALLRFGNKNEAFLLMNEGLKYHPSNLFKMMFKITKAFQLSLLLEMLIRIWFLFENLKRV